jgi:hypothetical protein
MDYVLDGSTKDKYAKLVGLIESAGDCTIDDLGEEQPARNQPRR